MLVSLRQSVRYGRGVLAASLILTGLRPVWGIESGVLEACPYRAGGVAVWISPHVSGINIPLKVMAVSADFRIDRLVVWDPTGADVTTRVIERGGPPWSLDTVLHPTAVGIYRMLVQREGKPVACREISVGRGLSDPDPEAGEAAWDRSTEAFFSAWIERLFDFPVAESVNLPSLKPVLLDPARNFLYDHFAMGEDGRIPAEPDCADLPYYLRAYFAWKNGLPLAYRACNRGSAGTPPRCGAATIAEDFMKRPAPASSFASVIRRVMDTVHSGSARTALADDATDFYPIPLRREHLWPGTVYADPYGHVLVIVKWVPQTADRKGMLLAVDAQPDNSVSRKRFWEGTFLFADDVTGAGPGFKAFRPLIRVGMRGRTLRLLDNEELMDLAPGQPYSEEQGELSNGDFYDTMGRLINPLGLTPEQAYEAAFEALMEQIETRISAIDNGEAYYRRHPGTVIPMPKGNAIFETVGPWEDYSTPSRDLRLLIAMHVLAHLPERVARYPGSFLLGGRSSDAVRADLERLHAERVQQNYIVYHRSDGSPWRLSVAEVLVRRRRFEVAYNPNDCAELRWGAEPGSVEYATCKRRAPAAQAARMDQYRLWFRDMRRPSR
jgi:hypothetical protein